MPTGQEFPHGKTVLDIAIDTVRNSNYGAQFRNFIYGNPEEELSMADCPMFIGEKERTEIEQETTAHDLITYTLLFRIVVGKYEIGNYNPDSDVISFRQLEDMIEAVDATTGLYDPNTILGLLRTQFTLSGYAVNQKITVDYSKVINPFVEEITREAQISMTVERLMLVPNRT